MILDFTEEPSLPIFRPRNERNFGWQQRLLCHLLPMQAFMHTAAGSVRRAVIKNSAAGKYS